MITIRIDERTKTGKAILEIAKIVSKDKKGVEIMGTATKKAKEIENIPNETTLRSMEKTYKGEDLTKTENHADLMNKLFS